MIHKFLAVICAAIFFPTQNGQAQTHFSDSFLDYGYDIKAKIEDRVFDICSLESVNAYHPQLPLPSVPADEAFARLSGSHVTGRVLAYLYNDENEIWEDFFHKFRYTKTNGSQLGEIHVQDHSLSFFQNGIRAQIQSYRRSGEIKLRYRCAGTTFSSNQVDLFEECLDKFFINRLSHIICQQKE